MDRVIFISHSSKDGPVAELICSYLEGRGSKCWIDSRDLLPGAEYAEQIIDAIETSQALVLLLSSAANASPHVRNEVERAVSKGKAVFAVRIEQVIPAKALELFVMAKHWVDAYQPPLGRSLHQLQRGIETLTTKRPPAEIHRPVPEGRSSPSGSAAKRGVITGNRVCVRTAPTVAARWVAGLNQGDEVDVLDEISFEESNECQLKNDLMFQPESGTPYKLMAGRGLVISGETETEYRVEIVRRQGTDIGYIPQSVATRLNGARWFRVRCGETAGWVLGRYVRAF